MEFSKLVFLSTLVFTYSKSQ